MLWKLRSGAGENQSYSARIFLLEFESEFESDTTVSIVPQQPYQLYRNNRIDCTATTVPTKPIADPLHNLQQ